MDYIFSVVIFVRLCDLSGGLRQMLTLTADVRGGAVCGAKLTQTAVFNRRRDTALSVVLNILLHGAKGAKLSNVQITGCFIHS